MDGSWIGRGLVVGAARTHPDLHFETCCELVVDGSWIGRESGRGLVVDWSWIGRGLGVVVDWSWIGRGLVVRRSSQRVRDAIRDGSVTPFVTHNL